MACWWIDEEKPYPGPYQEPTLAEAMQAFGEAMNGSIAEIRKVFKTLQQDSFTLMAKTAASCDDQDPHSNM